MLIDLVLASADTKSISTHSWAIRLFKVQIHAIVVFPPRVARFKLFSFPVQTSPEHFCIFTNTLIRSWLLSGESLKAMVCDTVLLTFDEFLREEHVFSALPVVAATREQFCCH